MDDPAGILARSLRGIGNSLRSLLSGIIDNDQTVFGRFVEADAVVDLLNGSTSISDTAAIAEFVAKVLVFPPGADRNAIFEVRWPRVILLGEDRRRQNRCKTGDGRVVHDKLDL